MESFQNIGALMHFELPAFYCGAARRRRQRLLLNIGGDRRRSRIKSYSRSTSIRFYLVVHFGLFCSPLNLAAAMIGPGIVPPYNQNHGVENLQFIQEIRQNEAIS